MNNAYVRGCSDHPSVKKDDRTEYVDDFRNWKVILRCAGLRGWQSFKTEDPANMAVARFATVAESARFLTWEKPVKGRIYYSYNVFIIIWL